MRGLQQGRLRYLEHVTFCCTVSLVDGGLNNSWRLKAVKHYVYLVREAPLLSREAAEGNQVIAHIMPGITIWGHIYGQLYTKCSSSETSANRKLCCADSAYQSS